MLASLKSVLGSSASSSSQAVVALEKNDIGYFSREKERSKTSFFSNLKDLKESIKKNNLSECRRFLYTEPFLINASFDANENKCDLIHLAIKYRNSEILSSLLEYKKRETSLEVLFLQLTTASRYAYRLNNKAAVDLINKEICKIDGGESKSNEENKKSSPRVKVRYADIGDALSIRMTCDI